MNNLLKAMHAALDDKFGKNIVILDISEISDWTDYFIIATGNNSSQMQAMADEIVRKAEEFGRTPKHMEGYNTTSWILIDFGDVVVHIFDKENRPFYNLERIWVDAKTVDLEKLNV